MTNSNKIKNIIFDLGNVLIFQHGHMSKHALSSILNVEENKVSQYWQPYWDKLIVGKITTTAAIQGLLRDLNIETISPEEVITKWEVIYKDASKDINYELLNMAESLSSKYDIYILTQTMEFHHQINSRRGIFDKFKKVFASHEVGYVKPDKMAYTTMLEEIGAKPEECLFIDDQPDYIEGAQSVGINTILFIDNATTKTEMAKFGVLLD